MKEPITPDSFVTSMLMVNNCGLFGFIGILSGMQYSAFTVSMLDCYELHLLHLGETIL